MKYNGRVRHGTVEYAMIDQITHRCVHVCVLVLYVCMCQLWHVFMQAYIKAFFHLMSCYPYRNDSVFKEVIEKHFLHHEKKIIETVSQWKDEADMVALELKEVCM